MHARHYMQPARALTILTLALVVGLPATAGAQPTRARVAALKARVTTLKNTVALQRQEIAGLQGQVAARTVERDQARARVTALTKQIASQPTQMQLAVQRVSREVTYGQWRLAQAGVPYSRGALIAHAAMEYVEGHVSPTVFGYMNEIMGVRPQSTAEATLSAGAGICGYASLTYAAILKRFGLPVRSVQFYYDDGRNHIAVEVFYDGDWHYFDAYYGMYYEQGGDVLSIAEARADPAAATLRHHDNQFWFTVASRAGLRVADLGYETSPNTRVEIDKQVFLGY